MTDPARRVAPNRVIRAAATSQFVVALCGISTIARAQEAPPPDSGSRWMIGGTIMMPRADGGSSSEFTFVGVTTATAKPGRPEADKPFEDRTPSIGFRAALAQHQFGGGQSGALRMVEIGIVRRSR